MNDTGECLDEMLKILHSLEKKELTKIEAALYGLSNLTDSAYDNFIPKGKPKAKRSKVKKDYQLLSAEILELYSKAEIPLPQGYKNLLNVKKPSARKFLYFMLSTMWVEFLIRDEFKNKLDTLDNRDEIGCIVVGLILFGSNRHQAEKATADWYDISYEKVQKAHVFWLRSHPSSNNSADYEYFLEWVLEAKKKNKRDFTSMYPQAKEAYDKLYNLAFEKVGHLYKY